MCELRRTWAKLAKWREKKAGLAMRDEPKECEAHQSPQKVLVDIDRRMVAMELAKECAHQESCAIRRNFFLLFLISRTRPRKT